jgi:hypothetical protein
LHFQAEIGLPRCALSKALVEPGSLVIVDSTGLKVYGNDEWHQEKHDVIARSTWRKPPENSGPFYLASIQ